MIKLQHKELLTERNQTMEQDWRSRNGATYVVPQTEVPPSPDAHTIPPFTGSSLDELRERVDSALGRGKLIPEEEQDAITNSVMDELYSKSIAYLEKHKEKRIKRLNEAFEARRKGQTVTRGDILNILRS